MCQQVGKLIFRVHAPSSNFVDTSGESKQQGSDDAKSAGANNSDKAQGQSGQQSSSHQLLRRMKSEPFTDLNSMKMGKAFSQSPGTKGQVESRVERLPKRSVSAPDIHLSGRTSHSSSNVSWEVTVGCLFLKSYSKVSFCLGSWCLFAVSCYCWNVHVYVAVSVILLFVCGCASLSPKEKVCRV